ncbi:MAG: hypothetical protein HW387_612 [Parachlamydiales bacterium]|nr:hypothetical protein [Parachlamydiales bacterium]
MFFRPRTPTIPRAIPNKIEVFARHCLFSKISQHKKRLTGFSREKCLANFLATIDPNRANVTFVLDHLNGQPQDHFLFRHPQAKILTIQEGNEAGSFLWLLGYIASLPLDQDTVIYIVEDDYLHRPGWIDILCEGFSIPGIDYVTLYDHCDKYFLPMYGSLKSKLYATPSCHWRTTPSTTNTFAVRLGTLRKDLPIHRRYSLGREISQDHLKFCHLLRKGRTLISPIPGWSTHAEPEYASPCIDWDAFLTT